MTTYHNAQLGQWVRDTLEENGGLSLRQAEQRTKISYMTIKGLLEGRQVNAETIMRFASAFQKEIPYALRLAGYNDLAELWEQRESVSAADPLDISEDTDFPEVLAAYRGLPVEMKAGVKAMIVAAHREHQRNQTTHGKKAR